MVDQTVVLSVEWKVEMMAAASVGKKVPQLVVLMVGMMV
jgi:hypothetical protein